MRIDTNTKMSMDTNTKMGYKLYLPENVLDAATKRISALFDGFKNIVVSISGGKDSTVLLELCRREALRRGREVAAFFLDQEAEYRSTIDQVKHLLAQEAIKPFWFQAPLRMTNATSLRVDFLNAWYPEERWMREKDPMAIHKLDADYPRRFYPFFDWWERNHWNVKETCFVVALRAEESLNRFRTVAKNPGWQGCNWTSRNRNTGIIMAYPMYDWTFEDVWHYIAENELKYNRIYDFMHRRGYRIQDVRVSYLCHENSLKCLESLHEFEPDTYAKLLERMPGIHVAARYSKENMIFNASKLPPAFESWKEYRDFLLETTPSLHIDRFRQRFAKQGDAPEICRQQCRQLLINDWEQNIPVVKPKQDKKDRLEKWRKIL